MWVSMWVFDEAKIIYFKVKSRKHNVCGIFHGAGDEIRTRYLVITN